MLSNAFTFVQALAGRALPVLVALQDAPRSAGGGGAPAGGGAGGAAAPASGGGPGGALSSLMLPLLMVVMVAFLFLSGRKQRKETDTMQKSLQKGDKVITTSGMVATVTGLDDAYVTLEISEKVRVKFTRDSIARRVDAAVGTAGAASKST